VRERFTGGRAPQPPNRLYLAEIDTSAATRTSEAAMVCEDQLGWGEKTERTGLGNFNQHFPWLHFKRFPLINGMRREMENLSWAGRRSGGPAGD